MQNPLIKSCYERSLHRNCSYLNVYATKSEFQLKKAALNAFLTFNLQELAYSVKDFHTDYMQFFSLAL
jgi:hypothetical protein